MTLHRKTWRHTFPGPSLKDLPLCAISTSTIILNFIKQNASSSIPIPSVMRLYRKFHDNNTTDVPTTSVKIGFNSKPIAKTTCFNYCVLQVSFLKPTLRRCFNCGRLAIKRISAKLKTYVIIKCGTSSTCTKECKTIKCVSCGSSSHDTLSRT